MFDAVYRDRRVLVTGHTGFKGAWLTTWLLQLGAQVTGYSAYMPSEPSYFEVSGLRSRITHIDGDVRDLESLGSAFARCRPEFVFHLAAQPLIRASYDDPKTTFDTNAGGTVNVLECVRRFRGVQAVVLVTSDKCYQNAEWPWGYRETDPLGGDDPYSASKACAELISRAYFSSFFSTASAGPRLATVRAGNVIGGGDWAANRIVPDCVRAWSAGESVSIRHPQATRPWQHVLEPLSGYLSVAARMTQSDQPHGEAFNFGPMDTLNRSVADLIGALGMHWNGTGRVRWQIEEADAAKKESTLLKLVCDKALHSLGWHPVLTFDQTVRLTAKWYEQYYSGGRNMLEVSSSQIAEYTDAAQRQGLSWTSDHPSA